MRRLWFVTVVLLATGGVWVVRAGISVHHKVLRKQVAEVPFEQIFSSSSLSSGRKTNLVSAEPQDGCDALESPPFVTLESVGDDGQDKIHWVILLEDSDKCSWYSRVTRAKVKGYAGVVAYSIKTDGDVELRKTDWNLLDGFQMNISIVSVEDAAKLKNYTYPKPYTITLNKDITWGDFLSEIYDSAIVLKRNIAGWYVKKVLAPLERAYSAASKFGWTIIVCVGLSVLIYRWIKRKLTEVEYEERRERTWHHNINNNAQDIRNEYNTLEGYRRLIGVRPGDTKKAIESAYRKKSREYHEDWMKRHDFSEREIERRTEIFKTVFPRALQALLNTCDTH